MASSVSHRVAVVGGGISGSICAALLGRQGLNVTLFEKSTHLGGRATSRALGALGSSGLGSVCDVGAHFITASDARFKMLVESSFMAGLLQEWPGRFGVLGGSSGAIMPREDVLETGMFRPRQPSQTDEPSEEPQQDPSHLSDMMMSPMNFCGFLEGKSDEKLYTTAGGRGLEGLSEILLQKAGVEVLKGAEVLGADFDPGQRQWSVAAAGSDLQFDTMVLANNAPDFAASVIQQLQAKNDDPELGQPEVAELITGFTDRLRSLTPMAQSCYSLAVMLPRPIPGLDFDALSVHGCAEVRFLSREAAKPGRGDTQECWVVQSTPQFAQAVSGEAVAAQQLWEAARRLLAKSSLSVPEPLALQVFHWPAAFFEQPLQLNAPGENHNDAVTFRPWGLALCADYLGRRQRVEEAALSGMMAANQIAGWAIHDR